LHARLKEFLFQTKKAVKRKIVPTI